VPFLLVALIFRVHKSLSGNIADIPSVYQAKGDVFLVAVAKDSDTVIGMVGGEFKHNEETGKDGSLREVYKVRRLSVGPEARGKGVGKSADLLSYLGDTYHRRLERETCVHLPLSLSANPYFTTFFR
jgi:GNAT superfamily N-acetyltransferase